MWWVPRPLGVYPHLLRWFATKVPANVSTGLYRLFSRALRYKTRPSPTYSPWSLRFRPGSRSKGRSLSPVRPVSTSPHKPSVPSIVDSESSVSLPHRGLD